MKVNPSFTEFLLFTEKTFFPNDQIIQEELSFSYSFFCRERKRERERERGGEKVREREREGETDN